MTLHTNVEEYITITDLMAGQKLFINNKEYTADENGSVFLSESMLKGEKGSPMEQFELKVDGMLNDLLKMNFYRMCGRGSSVILSSVANALEGNRTLAKQVLAQGEVSGVLIRGHNYTWRVTSKAMKERMLVLEDRISKLLNITQPDQSGDEFRKTVLSTYQKPVVDVVNEQSESVGNNMKQFQSTLPLPKTSKATKVEIVPKKKTPLSKPLVIARKPR